jgi:hypothetical protein
VASFAASCNVPNPRIGLGWYGEPSCFLVLDNVPPRDRLARQRQRSSGIDSACEACQRKSSWCGNVLTSRIMKHRERFRDDLATNDFQYRICLSSRMCRYTLATVCSSLRRNEFQSAFIF